VAGGRKPGTLRHVRAEYDIQVAPESHVAMAIGVGRDQPVGARPCVDERVRDDRAGFAPAVAGLVRGAGPTASRVGGASASSRKPTCNVMD